MASRIFWIFGPTLPSRTAELKGSIGNRTFMSICIGHLQRRESHYREAAAELRAHAAGRVGVVFLSLPRLGTFRMGEMDAISPTHRMNPVSSRSTLRLFHAAQNDGLSQPTVVSSPGAMARRLPPCLGRSTSAWPRFLQTARTTPSASTRRLTHRVKGEQSECAFLLDVMPS